MKKISNVIHYELTAGSFEWELAPGKKIQAWGFNGQLPGPAIRAEKGDTLVIHFKNNLNEPTMIHWHGIRLPAAMDGTGEVQPHVAPGESFEYRFVVPDAGTFWYHSHANETVQMERGLYGSLVVTDPQDPVVDADRTFMIDDMKLDSNNEFTRPGWLLPRWAERHDGREGETQLINGKEQPEIKIAAGQSERWRFINASSARYFTLYLGGHPFRIIATDGGLLEQPRTVTEVLLTPGERVDIIAGPFDEGSSFALESLKYDRMTMLKAKRRRYATVKVEAARPSVANIPDQLRQIPALAPQDAQVTRTIKLSVGLNIKNGTDFLVNGKTHVNDLPVKVGDLQVWEIFNASLMDHPFHLHGFFFQVLEENGKAPEYRAWKDTINIGPRGRIRIAWMPDNRPGIWMYHCHILEHHAAGMMANFEVTDGVSPLVMKEDAHHCHV